jgi:predicted DNA-binding transcriptional regulator YafY
MRRAQRLFQIIQILRRATGPLTAAALAEELEVSKRTVYRDVAELIGQRVPVEGEPGFGYLLRPGYDLPPLMLTRDEIEAIVLGAQWVMDRNDKVLAGAARNVIAKIVDVIPHQLKPYALEPSLGPRPVASDYNEAIDPGMIRSAVRDGRKLQMRYRDDAGVESERTVWPVILGYSDTARMLVAWCELRAAFRHFRTDRIIQANLLEPHGTKPTELRLRWQAWRASLGFDDRLIGAPPESATLRQ